MSLPAEILEIIASHWHGRTLRLTCRQLSRNIDVSQYLILERIRSNEGLSSRQTLIIDTSKLPDGRFHGKSCVFREGGHLYEVLEYAVGNIARADMVVGNTINQRDILIGGYVHTWTIGGYILPKCSKRDPTWANNLKLGEFMNMIPAFYEEHKDHGHSKTKISIMNRHSNAVLPHVC